MKVNAGADTLKGFKPDTHIVIKHDSTTGQTLIESGNGVPLNPLFVVVLLSGVVKENAAAIHQAQMKMQCNTPHAFVALAGEVKCRVPYCAMPPEHEIHNVPAAQV